MSSEIEPNARALKFYKGLVEVSTLIYAITDFNELLAAILDVARRVMSAEAGSLFSPMRKAIWNWSSRAAPAAGKCRRSASSSRAGHGIAGWVLENRKSALVVDAYADPRFYKEVDKKTGFRTRSILCVPLMHVIRRSACCKS